MPPSNLSNLSNLLHITWMTSPYPVAWPNHLLWVINTLQAQKEVMEQEIDVRALQICFSTSGDILRHWQFLFSSHVAWNNLLEACNSQFLMDSWHRPVVRRLSTFLHHFRSQASWNNYFSISLKIISPRYFVLRYYSMFKLEIVAAQR